MIALLICVIFLVVGFATWVFGWANENGDAMILGVIIMVFTLVLGFGVMCGACPVGEAQVSIIIPNHISKSEFVVFVKIDDQTLSDDTSKMVSSDIEKIRVEMTEHKTAYGVTLNETYKIVLAD